MTRFDAFTDALHALCVEHGMCMVSECVDWEHEEQYIELATEDKPAGCYIGFEERIAPTPEELAAMAAEDADRARLWAEEQAEAIRRHQEYINTPTYKARVALLEREAKRKREDYMRIATDPQDPAFIDARPRRVWLNDVEVLSWTTADEFRRCVLTADGVKYGSVRIERLEDERPELALEPTESTNNLCGMFVPTPKAEPVPVAEVAPSFAPAAAVTVKAAAKKNKRGR